MAYEENHLKRLSAMYFSIATFILLLSRSLTSDYELSQVFIAINHMLVFIIIIVLLKAIALMARYFKRPLKKDPLRIIMWCCFGINIMLTCMQLVAEKALLDSSFVTIISALTSFPVSLGVFCLFVSSSAESSKLKLHCYISAGLSLIYIVFRMVYIILQFSGIPDSSVVMTVFSKSGSVSLLLYFYLFLLGVVYYSITREREHNILKKEESESKNENNS